MKRYLRLNRFWIRIYKFLRINNKWINPLIKSYNLEVRNFQLIGKDNKPEYPEVKIERILVQEIFELEYINIIGQRIVNLFSYYLSDLELDRIRNTIHRHIGRLGKFQSYGFLNYPVINPSQKLKYIDELDITYFRGDESFFALIFSIKPNKNFVETTNLLLRKIPEPVVKLFFNSLKGFVKSRQLFRASSSSGGRRNEVIFDHYDNLIKQVWKEFIKPLKHGVFSNSGYNFLPSIYQYGIDKEMFDSFGKHIFSANLDIKLDTTFWTDSSDSFIDFPSIDYQERLKPCTLVCIHNENDPHQEESLTNLALPWLFYYLNHFFQSKLLNVNRIAYKQIKEKMTLTKEVGHKLLLEISIYHIQLNRILKELNSYMVEHYFEFWKNKFFISQGDQKIEFSDKIFKVIKNKTESLTIESKELLMNLQQIVSIKQSKLVIRIQWIVILLMVLTILLTFINNDWFGDLFQNLARWFQKLGK